MRYLNALKVKAIHGLQFTPLAKPTAELYFKNSLGSQIDWKHGQGAISGLGANSFVSDDALVIFRQESPAIVNYAVRQKQRRLIYFIDDDIQAGLNDEWLSDSYKKRLKRQYENSFVPLMGAADAIVTSTKRLAELVSDKVPTFTMNPYWSQSLSPFHTSELGHRKPGIKIVFLGARSHSSDLDLIVPAIAEVLSRWRNVEFYSFVKTPVLDAFLPQTKILRMRSWAAYKRMVESLRFDIALYPLRDTPFNQARSVNKLIEHSIVGAIGIYSKEWINSSLVADAKNGFLANNSHEGWVEAIENALMQQDCWARIYDRSRQLSQELNNPDEQRVIWQQLLSLTESPA